MNKYYAPWVAAGRHWKNAVLIQSIKDVILHAYPHAVIGTIGDESHLTAATPEGHTPYDVTGWPVATPRGLVTAIDIQGIPNLDAFAMRLVNGARAGTIKWIHYLNFNGHQWNAKDKFTIIHPSSDAKTHVHISIRTDHLSDTVTAATLLPVVSSHHTVVSGDTLGSIAEAAKTTVSKLYDLNKAAIEAAAKAHGEKSSDNGNLIYPGTVLTIP